MPTVKELKETLDAAGVEYPANALKEELEAMVNDLQTPAEEPAEVDETPEEVPDTEEDEFADVPMTEEKPMPQGKYRNETVIGVETRIMNGRMYRDVRTVQATYLLTEEEFAEQVTYE